MYFETIWKMLITFIAVLQDSNAYLVLYFLGLCQCRLFYFSKFNCEFILWMLLLLVRALSLICNTNTGSIFNPHLQSGGIYIYFFCPFIFSSVMQKVFISHPLPLLHHWKELNETDLLSCPHCTHPIQVFDPNQCRGFT